MLTLTFPVPESRLSRICAPPWPGWSVLGSLEENGNACGDSAFYLKLNTGRSLDGFQDQGLHKFQKIWVGEGRDSEMKPERNDGPGKGLHPVPSTPPRVTAPGWAQSLSKTGGS